MIRWLKQLFCRHKYKYRIINYGCYDQEEWYECIKCGKQKDDL